MKASFYNLIVPVDEKTSAIFNTLNDTIILTSPQSADDLIKNRLSLFAEEKIEKLHSLGMLIDDDHNEKDVLAARRQIAQHYGDKSHIFLTLTRRCNSKCVYCFQKKNKDQSILTEETAKGIRLFTQDMVEANRSSELQIDFFGGEPLLCRDLLQKECAYYESFALDKKIRLSYRFYTNGTLLSKKMVDWLSQRPIKDLQVTLDGPEEIHNAMRPLKNAKKNSFQEILGGLKRLKEARVPYVIRINFDNTNIEFVEPLMKKLVAEGLEGAALAFYPVQNMTEASCGHKAVCTNREVKAAMPGLWDAAHAMGFQYAAVPAVGYLYCTASCVSSAVIDNKGRVFKCALLQEDTKYQIGQITKDGFTGPNSEYSRWMNRNPLNWKKCSQCLLVPMCGGGCGGAGAHKNGTYEKPNCMFMDRNLLRSAIRHEILRGQPQPCSIKP